MFHGVQERRGSSNVYINWCTCFGFNYLTQCFDGFQFLCIAVYELPQLQNIHIVSFGIQMILELDRMPSGILYDAQKCHNKLRGSIMR